MAEIATGKSKASTSINVKQNPSGSSGPEMAASRLREVFRNKALPTVKNPLIKRLETDMDFLQAVSAAYKRGDKNADFAADYNRWKALPNGWNDLHTKSELDRHVRTLFKEATSPANYNIEHVPLTRSDIRRLSAFRDALSRVAADPAFAQTLREAYNNSTRRDFERDYGKWVGRLRLQIQGLLASAQK